MDRIQEALADLHLQAQPNISATARKYKINRSKLSRHSNGVSRTNNLAYENQRLLSNAQSSALIKYINDLTERGLPPTHAMVRNFASIFAGQQPGPHWVTCWLKAY